MAKIPIDFTNFVDRVSGSNQMSSTAVFADKIDLLRSRSQILSGRDKVLMDMYLDRGASYKQIAEIAGVSINTISRRIRSLTNRLLGSDYIACIHNRHLLSDAEHRVAFDRLIEGLSLKDTALKNGCTVYSVKKMMQKIQVVIGSKSEIRMNMTKGMRDV